MPAPDSWRRLGDVLGFVLDRLLALRPGPLVKHPGGAERPGAAHPGRRQATVDRREA